MKAGKVLCNSVSFAQLPDQPDYFIGRVLQNTDPSDLCSGSSWQLDLFQMNWTTSTLTSVRALIQTPVAIPNTNMTITTAYDPSVIQYHGEYWVAFECAGKNIAGPVSSCIAPFSLTGGVDVSRLTVAISGGSSDSNSPVTYSASVPKLLVFQGSVYLYWSAVKMLKSNSQWLGITTRGMQLAQESTGLKRFWAAGSLGSSVPSYAPNENFEVFGPNTSDPLSNATADSFQAWTEGDRIFLITGSGGKGCISPASFVYGCYHVQIASSTTPLGEHIFNNDVLSSPSLPSNPQEYSRIFTAPDGSHFMIGHYLDPVTNGSLPLPNQIQTGITKFPIEPSNFNFGSPTTSGIPAPAPTATTQELYVEFNSLSMFQPSCNSSSATTLTCASAIRSYCESQGYSAGGYGPSELSPSAAMVNCLRADSSSVVLTAVSTLTSYVPQCTDSQMTSDSCRAAVNRYCADLGYGGGGFPEDMYNGSVAVSCVGSSQGVRIYGSLESLGSLLSGCDSTHTSSASCSAAVSRFCQSQGYLSGYGILEHAGDSAQMGCFIKP